MKQKWKKIKGFDNYSISNDGMVRNDKRGVIKSRLIGTDGYCIAHLYKNGKKKNVRISRLVAEAFIPNAKCKPDVNHKDGNKMNNTVSNLEWVTKSENMIHAYQTGLNKPHPSYGMLGKKNPNGGSKGKPVRIVETGEIFDSIIKCANKINGKQRGICDALSGRIKTHRGYHFERI